MTVSGTGDDTDAGLVDAGAGGESDAPAAGSSIMSQLRESRTSRWGLYIIAVVMLVAVFTYVDAKFLDYFVANTYWYHPESAEPGATALLPPVGFENEFGTGTLAHPLGTDDRGRDLLVRVVYGTRIAIQVGVIATGIGASIGTVVGAVSGFYGGNVDDILQRAVEMLYAIPFLILIIAIMSLFGRDLNYAILGVSIISIPVFTRLIRSEVLSVREEQYIEAARAAGVKDRNIIFRHIIPNSLSPVLVQSTLQIGINILLIAGLSFLGFGVQPPTPSWGRMLAQSRVYMLPDPWFSIWPGVAILITVIGFNLLGDGLRDAFDPRLQ